MVVPTIWIRNNMLSSGEQCVSYFYITSIVLLFSWKIFDLFWNDKSSLYFIYLFFTSMSRSPDSHYHCQIHILVRFLFGSVIAEILQY